MQIVQRCKECGGRVVGFESGQFFFASSDVRLKSVWVSGKCRCGTVWRWEIRDEVPMAPLTESNSTTVIVRV